MKNLRYYTLLTLATAALCAPCGSRAQQTPAQQDSAGALKEVIVTAERRKERLVDVPISVTNIGVAQLSNADIQDLAGIAKLTPDLRFDSQGPWNQATIRGVGTSVVTTGSGSDVGIYIDGFFVPNALAADTQLLGIDSIQVLKGPQGTLFGRNTTGGAILVTTEQPSQQSSAEVDASYGSYGSQRYKFYGTTGLTDKIAVDLAALYDGGNGYFDNILTNNHDEGRYKNYTVRTGLKAELTDNLSVLVRYEHEGVDDPTDEEGNAYVLNGQPIALEAVIPGAIVATQPGEVSNAAPPHHPGFVTQNNIYQVTIADDLGFATLTSYSQYRQEDGVFYQIGDLGSIPIEDVKVPVNDDTVSQEFLLASKPGSRLQWTTGLYYFDYTDQFDANIALGGAPSYEHVAGSDTDTVSYAAYGDATYQLSEKWFLTAGLRFTHDEVKDGYYEVPFSYTRVYAPTLTGNNASPRVVLRYKPTEDSSIYASFTRGYKAGIYNLGGDSLAPVRPETISAYEIGYKYAAQRLTYDLASYYYKYLNLQVPSYGVAAGNVPIAILSNAADSRIYGFEGDVKYELTDNLQLNASAAYLNATYTSFPNAPGFAPCFTSPTVCGANYGQTPAVFVDASGFEMQRAPKYTASVGAQYSHRLAGGVMALAANYYYSAMFYEDPAHEVIQPGYGTLGLRAQWTNPSGRYTLALTGDNVTNKRYYLAAGPESGNYSVVWAAPAMVFGEIIVRYP